MSSELINQLSKLKLQKSSIKRNLDRNYYNAKVRCKLFKDLKEIDNEINRIKFKIRMERFSKNDNTDSTQN